MKHFNSEASLIHSVLWKEVFMVLRPAAELEHDLQYIPHSNDL